MSATAPAPAAPSAPSPAPSTPPRRRAFGRRRQPLLGLAWLHDHFHASTLAPGATAEWTSPSPVRTPAEFAAALDAAMVHLQIRGGEVHLILEQESFQHRLEQGPAASEAAAQPYLRNLVSRLSDGGEPPLWVSERAGQTRREASWCLHLMPASLYQQINHALRARRLELTRLVPLTHALQLELNALPEAADAPILLAATTGRGTVVIAARARQPLLFSRVMLETWSTDAARVGVELNRSLFYAKQQFGAVIQHIALRGPSADEARPEIQTRCNGGRCVTAGPADIGGWLRAVSTTPPRQCVNLLAGHLRRRQRDGLIRRALIALCWLALAVAGLDQVLASQRWHAELRQLAGVEASQPRLRAERQHLLGRNRTAEDQARLVAAIERDRLPPVPPRYLAYLAGTLPPEMQLTTFDLRGDPATGRWAFHLQGIADGRPETVGARLTEWQGQLAASPFRPRFIEAHHLAELPPAGPESAPRTRFMLEGELFAP